jgi:hypothetical protein
VRWVDGSAEVFPAPALGRYHTLHHGGGRRIAPPVDASAPPVGGRP